LLLGFVKGSIRSSPNSQPPVKYDGRITTGLHTAAPQAMRIGIPPLLSVAVAKKWSKRRALEYREMFLLLLQII